MPRRKDTKFTTFNDGSLDICSVKGRKIVETRQAGIRFGFRTVGIKRFYEAKVLSNQITRSYRSRINMMQRHLVYCFLWKE